MARRRTIPTALGAAVLLVAAGAGVAWLVGIWPGASRGARPAAPREPDRATAHGLTVYLMPVAADAVAARRPGEEVWDGLLRGIAADAGSRRLLSRLYGGVPAQLSVGPVGADVDAAGQAPGEGFAVAVRVDARRHEDRTSNRRGHVAGTIDLGRVSTARFHPARFHAPAGTPPEDVVSGAFSAAMAAQPDDFEVLLLVANDYLLRTQPGWQLFSHGFSADAVRVPSGGPAELRADLDRRIDDYIRRHAVSVELGGPKP